MASTDIVTLDLNFQGTPGVIASYLIRHSQGVVLVESGPGSTTEGLEAGLAARGFTTRDVTHVLLTHIHLDHAGAAGWLAKHGAKICVHPVGAPHLANPEKLLRSARRIYGDHMQELWGDFLPVPETSMIVLADGAEINIGGLRFIAIDTPGHAEHHFAYLFEDLCFSGDVGGVRISSYPYLRVPMPPPELHIEKWRTSIAKLRTHGFLRIAPTHFGIFGDAGWQLAELERALDQTTHWLEEIMPDLHEIEELRRRFIDRMDAEAIRFNLNKTSTRAYELANPMGMSADGLFRYWHKVRMAADA